MMPKSPDKTRLHQETVNTESDTEDGRKLPHERDESAGATRDTPHPEMEQAHEDVKKGLVDADARGPDGKPLGSKKPAR
jgi:hypothetical protein